MDQKDKEREGTEVRGKCSLLITNYYQRMYPKSGLAWMAHLMEVVIGREGEVGVGRMDGGWGGERVMREGGMEEGEMEVGGREETRGTGDGEEVLAMTPRTR